MPKLIFIEDGKGEGEGKEVELGDEDGKGEGEGKEVELGDEDGKGEGEGDGETE